MRALRTERGSDQEGVRADHAGATPPAPQAEGVASSDQCQTYEEHGIDEVIVDEGVLAGGRTALHISTISSAPAPAAIRMPTPRTSAVPIAARPSMNNQSVRAAPAMLWYRSANGPFVPAFRNPSVGWPPLTHAFASVVSWPSPKVLSKNAHKKIQPNARRATAHTYVAADPPFGDVSVLVPAKYPDFALLLLCHETRVDCPRAASPPVAGQEA
jgi:hypothetical protein